MKYTVTAKVYGRVLNRIIREKVKNSHRRNVLTEYGRIVRNAKDIGSKNNLLSAYLLAAYFIAMNRTLEHSPEENLDILETGMRKSKMLRMFMGSGEAYFSEKKMEARRKWAQLTHEEKYENDWIVDVIPGNDQFAFGFDYSKCGVCALCRDEGCPELSKYLCRLDYLLVEIMGIKLLRTETLAEGGNKCDFRFIKP